MNAVYYWTDINGRITDIHPAISQYGYDPRELIGRPVLETCLHVASFETLHAQLQRTGMVRDYEVQIRTNQGTLLDASLDARLILDNEGKPIAVEGALREVARGQAGSQRREQDDAAHKMLLGLTRDMYNPLTIILENLSLVKSEDFSQTARQSLEDIERCVHQIKFVLEKIENADLSNPAPVAGTPDVSHDVERQKLEEALKSAVITDPLTGAYNRTFFDKLLEKEVVRSKRYKRTVSIMQVTVERLKGIVDRYGRGVGNQLMVESARILTSSIRTSDTMARSGAQGFLILLPETDQESSRIVIERIEEKVKRFNESVFLPPLQLTIRCSFCTGPDDAPKSLAELTGN